MKPPVKRKTVTAALWWILLGLFLYYASDHPVAAAGILSTVCKKVIAGFGALMTLLANALG